MGCGGSAGRHGRAPAAVGFGVIAPARAIAASGPDIGNADGSNAIPRKRFERGAANGSAQEEGTLDVTRILPRCGNALCPALVSIADT